MKTMHTRKDRLINFKLSRVLRGNDVHRLFYGIRNSLRDERKLLILGKAGRQETESFFNFMKFLFESPDRVV